MVFIKKYRYKPVYKKFANLKSNIQNRQKLLKFKKNKWKNLLFKINLSSKYKKRNCYYKFYDQNSYSVSKFSDYFSRKYSQNIINKRSFQLFYGGLCKRYLKNIVNRSIKKSNNLNNSIKTNIFFESFIERRLDVILLKSNFVLSIRNARQLISHGHVLVNNEVIKNNSFLIKTGDKVTLQKNSHNLVQYYILKSEFWPLPPTYLQISYSNLQIRVVDETTISKLGNNKLNLSNVINTYQQ